VARRWITRWPAFAVTRIPHLLHTQNTGRRPDIRHLLSGNTTSICRKCVLFLCFVSLPAHAQDTQFLPEVDSHLTVNSRARVYLVAKDDREGGDPHQFTFGPSIQFYLKPLIKLQHVTLFNLDDSKSRPLVLESGYRIVTAPDTPVENRLSEVATFHFPLMAGILLSDGNTADLDWQNESSTWRYHNKLTLERSLPIHSYHPIPYIAVEPFYESQHNKWSATDFYAGCLLPVGKHVEFNPYYEYENNTGKSPNQSYNFIGLTLRMYFSLHDATSPHGLQKTK